MADTILVTGGTGTLGRPLVTRLRALPSAVRVFSRRCPPPGIGDLEWVAGDLNTGVGLDQAVSGVRTVVHCATDSRMPWRDLPFTKRLVEAVSKAGEPPHLVYISIVGVDKVPLPYYKTKLQAERLIESCGLPWTILRTTQFHDLLFTVLRVTARLPVIPIPARTPCQPVDVGEVADRLTELINDRARVRAADFGGPRVQSATELASAYLRWSGRRRALLPVWIPGRIAAGYRRGGHLAPEHAVGKRSFQDFLDDLNAPAHSSLSARFSNPNRDGNRLH
jgi:uncharacterized protein YbjT (DUF2867 family)